MIRLVYLRILFLTGVLTPGWLVAQSQATDSLEQVFYQHNKDSVGIEAALALCDEWSFLQTDTAWEWARRAYALAEDLQSPSLTARSLYQLGAAAYDKRELQQAMAYFLQAMERFEELGDDRRRMDTRLEIGLIYQDMGEYGQARQYLDAFYQFYARQGAAEAPNIIFALNQFVVLFEKMQEVDSMLHYARATLKAAEQYGQDKYLANIHNNLASVYLYAKDYPRAQHHFQQAERIGFGPNKVGRYYNFYALAGTPLCWPGLADAGGDSTGYWLAVAPLQQPATLLEQAVEGCGGGWYHLSADLAPLLQDTCIAPPAEVTFLVNGAAVYTAGPLPANGGWETYAHAFELGTGPFTFSLVVASSPVAIDQLKLQYCQPELALPDTLPFCPDQAALLELSGADTLFEHAQWQWQRSFDSGNTWADIPGATLPTFLIDNPVQGILYRLQGANSMPNPPEPGCLSTSAPVSLLARQPVEVFQTPVICEGDTAFIGDTPLVEAGFHTVARDAGGTPYASVNLGVRISLVRDGVSGLIDYSERHQVTTSPLGVFDLEIGGGLPISGAFADADWANHPYYLKVDIDPTGGTNYMNLGTSQLLSVPYAIYAGEAGNGGGGGDPTDELQNLIYNPSMQTLTLTNGNSVTLSLPSGTDAQTLSLTGTELSIENGNTVDLSPLKDGVEDADANPTNELQDITFNPATNQLSISNGSTVTLPSGGTDADADPTNELQSLNLSGNTLSL